MISRLETELIITSDEQKEDWLSVASMTAEWEKTMDGGGET